MFRLSNPAATVFCIGLTYACPSVAAPDTSKPLGDQLNPVRACGSEGQQEYLRRLVCASGESPTFSRDGSYGRGPYNTVIERYSLACGANQFGVFMDMYHCKYRESIPISGFTILPELPARSAMGCPPLLAGKIDKDYVFYGREVETPTVTPPELLKPPKLAGAGNGGWTFISGVVNTDGQLEEASLRVTSNDQERNLKPIVEFVKLRKFKPAIHHAGCAVKQSVDIRVEFPAE